MMKNKTFNIIAAIDAQNGIGKEGKIPWKLSSDLRHFKEITLKTESPFKRNAVIMGRKTWESIPQPFKPLERRVNIVLTRDENIVFPSGVIKADSLESALAYAREHDSEIEEAFIIGGQQIYEQAVRLPECKYLYITQLLKSFGCDTFFPPFEDKFKRESGSEYLEEGMITYHFSLYARKEGF